jgi:hypothetical protein
MSNENLKACPMASTSRTERSAGENDYDDANIADVRNAWEMERKTPGAISHQAYTMVQANAACEVEVTQESRRACVEALLR